MAPFSPKLLDLPNPVFRLWSVDEVRTLLQTSYVWSNPNKYLRQATIQMTPFDGEVPERWKRLVLPSLRTGQAQVKPEEEKYYDAPGSPVKAEAVKIDADEKKALKAFHRLMGADAPGPSGLHAMDVKEERPPKRPHPNDRLGSTAAKRRCQGLPTAALQPVARKASQPPLEGPLADRKLSDVDGIDEFVAKRLMEKVCEGPGQSRYKCSEKSRSTIFLTLALPNQG